MENLNKELIKRLKASQESIEKSLEQAQEMDVELKNSDFYLTLLGELLPNEDLLIKIDEEIDLKKALI